MDRLLKLPNLNKLPVQAKPKLIRTTGSLPKRFCLMLLMQPGLASKEDLLWIVGSANEELLLRETIETCLTHPHSNPVVIMRALESKVDRNLFLELERELSLLDETLDFALELAGARVQLQLIFSQQQENILLANISEKSLSSLTEDEKALLKAVGNKPSQKKAEL